MAARGGGGESRVEGRMVGRLERFTFGNVKWGENGLALGFGRKVRAWGARDGSGVWFLPSGGLFFIWGGAPSWLARGRR